MTTLPLVAVVELLGSNCLLLLQGALGFQGGTQGPVAEKVGGGVWGVLPAPSAPRIAAPLLRMLELI